MKKEIKVKFVHRGSLANEDSSFKKQFPNNQPKWGSCIFTFNPLEKNYDWLVIIDDMPKIIPHRTEVLQCPKENTILITTEPASITRYGSAFAKQFHYLITNQSEEILPHPNSIRSQTGNMWFYGKDYDTIIKTVPPKKTKKISTVCSSKQQGHTMHRLRYEFTRLMQDNIPQLERFGKGFKWIETKAEALDNYEFHVAIENHIAPNVWTEKLADACLGYAIPIYCGCPNVYDYFPKDSLVQIDIHDMKGSIKKIQKIISIEGEYERRLNAVKKARKLIIEKYNILAMISDIVEKAEEKNYIPNQKIYSRKMMRVKHLPDLFKHISFKIDSTLKEFKK